MSKKILKALLILTALLLAVGLFLPRDFEASREIVIAAPPAAIHHEVGDLTRWKDWTPWRLDGDSVRITISRPSSGPGASLSWTDQGGSGKLTILRSSPQQGLDYELRLGDHADQARAGIHYQPAGDATRVTWRMRGRIDLPVLGGYLAILAGKSVGAAFESGLRKLKQVVETQSSGQPSG